MSVELHQCEVCGVLTRAKIVCLRQNISYLWARQETVFCGRACPRCLTRMALSFTFKTLLLTWFGVVGVAVGPLYILFNVYEALSALGGVAFARMRQPAP